MDLITKKKILSRTGITVAGIFLITLTVFVVSRALFPVLDHEAAAPGEALARQRFFLPEFRDDTEHGTLGAAVRKSLEYLDRIGPDREFSYGTLRAESGQVRATLELFLEILSKNPTPEELDDLLKENFQFFRAAGRKGDRDVLFTGYFEPLYEGSLQRDEIFDHPLYRRPGDLLNIDLSPFGEDFKGKRISARIEGTKVLPYYSRRDIEKSKVLQGRGLEIAWLKNPVDVAFLHIQGSGCILLPDGDMISVGYAASNGRPYRSIGRYMIDKGFLTRDEMSMQAIRRYLMENPETTDEVLDHNPSYIFFRTRENGPFGNINVRLTPGRSIALDSRLFPKGALCFITAKKPVVEGGRVTGWTDFSRFVLNQDTGGAIRGAGRADIFWGRGEYAELAAGHLKHEGELYVLLKK